MAAAHAGTERRRPHARDLPTLVAEAFQSVPFPILPVVHTESAATPECHDCIREIFQIRDHNLYTPRDFDVSPYFEIIKPSLTQGFNYKTLAWDSIQRHGRRVDRAPVRAARGDVMALKPRLRKVPRSSREAR